MEQRAARENRGVYTGENDQAKNRKTTEVQYFMRFHSIACIRSGYSFHRRTEIILSLLHFTGKFVSVVDKSIRYILGMFSRIFRRDFDETLPI